MSVVEAPLTPLPSKNCEPLPSITPARAMLAAGAVVAGTLASAGAAESQAAPYNATSAWQSISLRLVRRVTYGLAPREVQLVKDLGYKNYLEYHLNYLSIDDSSVENFLQSRFPALRLNMPDIIVNPERGQLIQQVGEAMLYRAAFSKRQLFERMVEFWTDHFSIYQSKVRNLKAVDDREVIRKYAMTTFPKLLTASAHSPAMLHYLDNTVSLKRRPNQNYARELMELHTLGVNGGYTQQDVLELARCLTGWQWEDNRQSPNFGQFTFSSSIHDNGEKQFLGVVIPANGGKNDGDMALKLLAEHPSTAQYIAYKMTRWLLQYDPPSAIVDSVARTYTQTKGDIRAMIRVILNSQNLKVAPAKFKRPTDLVASAMQAICKEEEHPLGLSGLMNHLGQPLFEWGPPNGYPDSMAYWAGGMVPRWNMVARLTSNLLADIKVSVQGYQGLTAEQIAGKILREIFANELDTNDYNRLLAYLNAGSLSEGRIREALSLALSCPSFQWR